MLEPRPRVSVCLASHDGAVYLGEQLDSILGQLAGEDELIVVDDASTDATLSVLAAVDDPRLRVVASRAHLGHVQAFARALAEASGDVVLLSDQDDVWFPGRVERMCEALRVSGAGVVAGQLRTFGGSQEERTITLPHLRSGTPRWWQAFFLGRVPYFGSAMGCTREVLDAALPIPHVVEAHDQWLALVGACGPGIVHVDSPVTWRRLHGHNLTPTRRRRLLAIARTRWIMLVTAWLARRRSSTSG